MGGRLNTVRDAVASADERVADRLAYLAARRFGLPPTIGLSLAVEVRAAQARAVPSLLGAPKTSPRALLLAFDQACRAHIAAAPMSGDAASPAGAAPTPPMDVPLALRVAEALRGAEGPQALLALAAIAAAPRPLGERLAALGADRADLRRRVARIIPALEGGSTNVGQPAPGSCPPGDRRI